MTPESQVPASLICIPPRRLRQAPPYGGGGFSFEHRARGSAEEPLKAQGQVKAARLRPFCERPMASRDHGRSMSFRDGTDGDTDACATAPRHHRHHCCRPPHSTVIPPSGPSAPGEGAQPEPGAAARRASALLRLRRSELPPFLRSHHQRRSVREWRGRSGQPHRASSESRQQRGTSRMPPAPLLRAHGRGRGRECDSPGRYLHTQPLPRRGNDRRATSLPSPGIDTWLSPHTHRL